MKKFLPILKNTQLFSGVSEAEVASLLTCLNATMRTYQKGEYLYRRGSRLEHIAVLVDGELHIQRDDYWGNRSILERVDVGGMFGEAYLAPESGVTVNDVVAAKNSTVMFFDVRRVITTCSSACRFHTSVVQNLFFSISEKNRTLEQKLGHMSRRTTREKLISYLSEESRRHNSSTFTIPFNRQQLADFLSVDRSAMSNELSKLQNEGLLTYHKNQFTLM